MKFNCVFHFELQFSVLFLENSVPSVDFKYRYFWVAASFFKFSSVLHRLGCEPEKNAWMPKRQTSTAFVVLATPSDAAFLLFHIDGGNKGSLKFFTVYVFWKYEHNSSIFSTSLELRESCSHTFGISSTKSLKEDSTFSSFSKAKAGIFSPSSPILWIK